MPAVLGRLCSVSPPVAKLCGFSAIQACFAFANKLNRAKREKRACDVESLLMGHSIEHLRCISVTQEVRRLGT
jgi:hypothetical protein